MFPRYFRDISEIFRDVSAIFPRYFRDISEMFSRCLTFAVDVRIPYARPPLLSGSHTRSWCTATRGPAGSAARSMSQTTGWRSSRPARSPMPSAKCRCSASATYARPRAPSLTALFVPVRLRSPNPEPCDLTIHPCPEPLISSTAQALRPEAWTLIPDPRTPHLARLLLLLSGSATGTRTATVQSLCSHCAAGCRHCAFRVQLPCSHCDCAAAVQRLCRRCGAVVQSVCSQCIVSV